MFHAFFFFFIFPKFKKALELKVFVRKTCDLQYSMLYKNKTRTFLEEACIIWVRSPAYIYTRPSMCQTEHHFKASQKRCVPTVKDALRCLQLTANSPCYVMVRQWVGPPAGVITDNEYQSD